MSDKVNAAYHPGDGPADGLRERVLAAVRDSLDAAEAYATLATIDMAVDAVLAVVDPDGLRAEVERLRAWKGEALAVMGAYQDLAQRVVPDHAGIGRRWSDLLAEHIDTTTAERDGAVREAAELRTEVAFERARADRYHPEPTP